jgi:hypothetical protein
MFPKIWSDDLCNTKQNTVALFSNPLRYSTTLTQPHSIILCPQNTYKELVKADKK